MTSIASDASPQTPMPETIRPVQLTDRIVEIISANPTNAILQHSMFQIVVLAILMAVALVSLTAERAKPLLDLCVSLQDVSMKVVSWAMVIAPAGVFGLLAQVIVESGVDVLLGMSVYIGTVLLGLILLLTFYLLIVVVVARRNLIIFLSQIRDAQLLAFSTSSLAAVMPLSMKIAKQELSLSPNLSYLWVRQ